MTSHISHISNSQVSEVRMSIMSKRKVIDMVGFVDSESKLQIS